MSKIISLVILFLVLLFQFPQIAQAATISPSDWTPILLNTTKTITISGLNPDWWYFWNENGPSGFTEYTHCFKTDDSGVMTQDMGPYTITGDYILQLTPDGSPNPPITFDPGSTVSGEGCAGSGPSAIGDQRFQVIAQAPTNQPNYSISVNPTTVSKSSPQDINITVNFGVPNIQTYILYITKGGGTPGGIAFNIICNLNDPSNPQCTMSVRTSNVKMQVGSFTTTLQNNGGNWQAKITLVNTQNMDAGPYNIRLVDSTDQNNALASLPFTILEAIVDDVKMVLSPTTFASTADSAGKTMTVTLTQPTAEIFDVFFNPDNTLTGFTTPVATINCTSSPCIGQFSLPSCGLNPFTYSAEVHDRQGVGRIRGIAQFTVQGDTSAGPGTPCGGFIPAPISLPYNTPATSGGSQCIVDGSPGFNTAIGCIPTNPDKLVKAVLTFVIGVSGGLAFLLMLLGAFEMLTSAGNPETLNAGRDRFVQAIIGLLFIVFSVLLLQIIGVDILGLRELQPPSP